MGERFAGRYELVDHLGDGGAGSVWRAWDARRERYVAAKLLRQRDAGALLRFVREQSVRVAHPHVVAPTGWAAEDDDVLLTMDLVAGGSVAALLGDYARVPASFAATLLAQLLDALAAVHAAGLVHRDVKPANLLLEPTGTAPPVLRLADFGIAVLLDGPRLTATGHVVGTGGYLAPEVLRGADPDPRQDLWSVGVVGMQLVSGRRPDAAGGLPEVPAAAAGLVAWLRTLTRDDPDARCPDAVTALRELHSLDVPLGADEEPVEVFDHLPPLPAGWGPDGPDVTPRAAPAAGLVEQGVAMAAPTVTGPTQAGSPTAELRPPPTETLTRTGPGSAVLPPQGAGGAALPPQGADGASLPPQGAGGAALPLQGAGGAALPPQGSGGPARGTVVRLVLAALLVVVAVVAFTRARAAGEDPGTPAPPGVAETGARAGDPCLFTDVGTPRSADGRLVQCRRDGGGYRWLPA